MRRGRLEASSLERADRRRADRRRLQGTTSCKESCEKETGCEDQNCIGHRCSARIDGTGKFARVHCSSGNVDTKSVRAVSSFISWGGDGLSLDKGRAKCNVHAVALDIPLNPEQDQCGIEDAAHDNVALATLPKSQNITFREVP